ncbi:MAG: chlorite dismutase family protein [Chloroflexi bacterium]|nr:chlorite dismutase family protein [Chloroflexota bacterium]
MTQGKRQFVKYNAYRVDPLWRRLPEAQRQQDKEEFLAVVDEFTAGISIRSYSLVGLRADADLLLWCISETLESLQELVARLYRTGLGGYLSMPYSFLAMTRPSPYVEKHRHAEQEGASAAIRMSRTPYRYLVVYPFVKTAQWYLLPVEERQRMMDEHFAAGHKYPSVKINTSYSFGLDDQEFMLAFETNNLSDFLELVMELREQKARLYTLRDTPILTCIQKPLREALQDVGG